MLRQTEIHIAVPLVSELSVFGDETVFDKLRKTHHQVLIKS